MLKGGCFFPLLKLIKKVNLKQDIKNLTVNVTNETDEEKKAISNDNGLDLAFIIIDKIADAEKETWDFMTVYLEKPIEEIKEMDIFDIAEIIAELIKDKRFQTVFHKAIS